MTNFLEMLSGIRLANILEYNGKKNQPTITIFLPIGLFIPSSFISEFPRVEEEWRKCQSGQIFELQCAALMICSRKNSGS